MRLTVKAVERIREAGRYLDADGLYLQVSDTGAKSWLLRYALNKRERWMGLGSCKNFTLDEARERARRQRQLLTDGKDPLDEKRAARAAQAATAAAALAAGKTFAEVTDDYFRFHSPSWSNLKHAKQFLSSLRRYAFPTPGKLPVAAIDNTMIIETLRPIWNKDKASTASRVRGRIERVLDYAKVNKFREGDNPAAWANNLEHAFPSLVKVEHHAALPYVEMYEFMSALRSQDSVVARALEFTVLTASRSGEVRGAVWSEIDTDARTWTIPKERMKSDREHRVPLSNRAVEILQGLPRDGDHLFIGVLTKSAMGMNAMASLLKDMRPGATVHGFRSSFRDWCADCSNYPNDVIEMCLAHAVGSGTEKAYKRTDLFARRVRLMEDWSKYCAIPPVADGKVVALRQKA
jgi:integrase